MQEYRQVLEPGTTVTITTAGGGTFAGEIISIGKLEVKHVRERAHASLHFFPWLLENQPKTTMLAPEFLILRLQEETGQYLADQQVCINVGQIIAIG